MYQVHYSLPSLNSDFMQFVYKNNLFLHSTVETGLKHTCECFDTGPYSSSVHRTACYIHQYMLAVSPFHLSDPDKQSKIRETILHTVVMSNKEYQ
jgi:hypothetical protein